MTELWLKRSADLSQTPRTTSNSPVLQPPLGLCEYRSWVSPNGAQRIDSHTLGIAWRFRDQQGGGILEIGVEQWC